MTDISNVKNGAQVVNLQPVNARDPSGPGGIDRFASAEAKASKGSQTTSNNTGQSSKFTKGQDPLEQAAKAIDEFVSGTGTETKLRIDRDADTGRFVYKSIDAESGEVINQFPPETILQIISKFRDPEGLILDDTA